MEEVADHNAWKWNKEVMLQFYADRWNNVQAAEPNAAHKAIAKLQEKYNVINITQNVDDLLERAGCMNVWHLHGSLSFRKCEWHSSIAKNDKFSCNYKIVHNKPATINDFCPLCGGHLRPDVVWFGEAVDLQDKYLEQLKREADIFIGVGTSAQVYPAAGLIFEFKDTEKKYWVDPEPPLRLHSFTKFAGKAGEQMPKLVEELLNKDND